jgi:hypothetical protein
MAVGYLQRQVTTAKRLGPHSYPEWGREYKHITLIKKGEQLNPN